MQNYPACKELSTADALLLNCMPYCDITFSYIVTHNTYVKKNYANDGLFVLSYGMVNFIKSVDFILHVRETLLLFTCTKRLTVN